MYALRFRHWLRCLRNHLSIAEAKKRVSELDIAEYERKAQKYVAERDFSKQANEEMRLYNLTMKVNRLEMLKANIGLECIAGHDELEKYMGDILKGRTMEELQRQAGILGKSIRNNAHLANVIVNASFHNAKFSDRIWMNQSLLKAELEKSLQTGLIQGRNARALARDIQKQFGVSKYNAERLMRTELARVQTEAQKQSFENNGFEEYEFITNSGCCDACQALDGKHFKVKSMMPGDNAPPLHPNCRCSIAAYEDDDEYEAWLDYLDKGGSTEEWNDHGRAEWQRNNSLNQAKAIDSMKLVNGEKNAKYSREEILQELAQSPIGKDTIRAIRDSNVKINIYDIIMEDGRRGDQCGDNIRIFSSNSKSIRVAGQTLIHEMAHYRFGIGDCQHAEAICFAMEKMHLLKRDYLTKSEWNYVKQLAIDNYPEYDWEVGGYGNYEQFDFIKDDD